MNSIIRVQPRSEDEWTIHAINIHGVFFERWCQKGISDSTDWRVRSTNYPVEYPPPNGPWRGRESTLDIEASLQRDDLLVTLLIECKKNNPEFINWIFFPNRQAATNPFVFRQIENVPREAPNQGWNVTGGLKTVLSPLVVADEARETRGTYLQYQKGDKTKTSNAAISDAAHQIALATQAIALERGEYSKKLGSSASPPPMPWKRQVFLPMIVTTARLFTCDFDPGHVDPVTGEIPFGKANITERGHLVFEYPLPRQLQIQPADLVAALMQDSLRAFMLMHILVVHSGKFLEVLHWLATEANQF